MPDLAATLTTIGDRVADLAVQASALPDLRAQLAEVRVKMSEALDEYSAGITAVNKRHSAAMGPLSRESKELLSLIESAETAEAKLSNLEALLNPPATPPVTPPTPVAPVDPEPEPTPIEPAGDVAPLADVAVADDDDDGDDILFALPSHTPELQESIQ